MHPDTSKKDGVKAPKFMVGKSGAQAMWMWEKIYNSQGDAGLARAEKEFDVFVWSTRNAEIWPLLTQTPDEIIPKERKVSVLRKQLKEIGVSDDFAELIVALFYTPEISAIEQIRYDFLEINREHRREVDVQLVTPADLSPEQLKFLKSSISLNFLKEGDNMIFSHTVDPSIEGGYKVTVKGNVHDFTHNTARENAAQARRAKADAESRAFSNIVGKFRKSIDSIFTEGLKKDIKELDCGHLVWSTKE